MDKELQQYYEERFSTFSTKGWKQLLEDVRIMRDNYALISTINNLEELHYRKGQLDILEWLLSIEAISKTAYDDLL